MLLPPRKLYLGTIVALLLGVGSLPARAQLVHVYQTAADLSSGMRPQPLIAFSTTNAGSGQVSLMVDEHSRYQKIESVSASPHCHSQTSNLAHSGTGIAPVCAVPEERSLADEANRFLVTPLRAGARILSFWSQESAAGVDRGSCGPCRNLMTVDTETSISDARYGYALILHASQFVNPGAYRIQSDSSDSSALPNVAFRNPDGTIVVVAVNSTSAPVSLNLFWSRRSITYRQAAGAIATIVWNPQEPPVSLQALPAEVTLVPGRSVSARLVLKALPGTAPRASISCAAPHVLHCEISPERLALEADKPATATVTITTTPSSDLATSSMSGIALGSMPLLWGMVFLFRNTRKTRRSLAVWSLLCIGLLGCGDGRNSSESPAISTGDYELTITVTPDAGAPDRTSLSVHVTATAKQLTTTATRTFIR